MIKGIYLSSKAMKVHVRNIESIGNNLANLNSVGYKRQLPFSEILSNEGKLTVRQVNDFSDGHIYITQNPLDLALSGNGFFVVEGAEGPELTRRGKFKISDEGFIVNDQGQKLMGKKGPVNLNEFFTEENRKISVTKEGDLYIGDTFTDSIIVAGVEDGSKLVRINSMNFKPEDDAFTVLQTGMYQVQQGYLEESNVNPVHELSAMIQFSSDFESSQKMMNSLDDSLGKAIEIGKI